MPCTQDRAALEAYLDGELGANEEKTLQQHFAGRDGMTDQTVDDDVGPQPRGDPEQGFSQRSARRKSL